MERGQIDAVTLMLLTLAGYWYVRNEPGKNWLAGIAFALAVVLKLYCVFLLPFLLVRKRWSILAGFMCGLIGLMAGSILVKGGIHAWQEYIHDVLPRISYHNEGLAQERVDLELINRFRGDAAEDTTLKDGWVYKLYGFNFSSNASLVRVILDEFFEHDARINRTMLSLLELIGLSLLFIPWLQRAGAARTVDRQQEFLFWQLVMVIILLAAPLTWTMNVVWLLPIGAIVISTAGEPGPSRQIVPLIIMALGILVAALPDHKTLELIGYFEKSWLNHKYVIAESIVLGGGVLHLTSIQRRGESIRR
jgi:hypothetical protein